MKKIQPIQKLIDLSSHLPEYGETSPGIPLDPPLLPREFQFYYRTLHTINYKINYFLHNKYIMLFCLFGNRKIEVDGRIFQIHPKEFLLIPPQTEHTTNQAIPQLEKEEFGILYASFLLSDPDKKMSLISKKVITLKDTEIRLLRKSVAYFQNCFEGNLLSANRTVYAYSTFLMHLLNRFTEHGEGHHTTYLNKNTLLLKQIQACVQKHQNRNLRIADIAHEVGVSPSLLRLIFRKEMKMSLGYYILTRTMQRINELLRSTDMSLSEIATETGYNTEASMIRAYKRESGMTPRKAREKLRMEKTETIKRTALGKMQSAASTEI